MERLTAAGSGQDVAACIAYCYQLNQPVNVQAVDSQTVAAVQSLLDSQVVAETQEEEEEDIFQCGKCKKQFRSLSTFVAHKQAQCVVQQQQQSLTLPHGHPARLTLNAGANTFASAISSLTGAQALGSLAGAPAISSLAGGSTLNPLAGALSQAAVNGSVSAINPTAPILQAHPCLTRTLNQPSHAPTLTLGPVPSSPISQLSQNMVFTDELMTLSGLDTATLGAPTIQMVTGTVHGQAASTPSNVTIFSPLASLAAPNSNLASTAATSAGQLLVQPGQQITLTSLTDKSIQQQQHFPQSLPPPPPVSVTVSQSSQQPVQSQMFKPSPTKAGRRSAQNKLITVLNADNSVSLLSTRKGKTAKHAKNNNADLSQDELNIKAKLQCEYCNKEFTKNFDLQQHIRAHTGEKPFQCIVCGRAFAQKSNVKKHMATHKNKLITVLNADNSVSLLSTRKGKTAKHAKNNNADLSQDELNIKAKLQVWPCGTSNTLPRQPEPLLLDKSLPEVAPTQATSPVSSAAVAAVVAAAAAATAVTSASSVIANSNNGASGACDQLALTSMAHKLNALKTSTQQPEMSEEKSAKMKVVVDNSYICQYCPAKFKTYYQLKSHLVTHKCEQVYKCVMKSCGQSFHDLDSFLEHMKSHEEEMNYRCHQCHKYFKNLYELGVHQYSHIYMNQGVKSGPRHFQCTKCGNKYTTPEALEHHASTTSHDYKCPHCQKQFTCERFLRRHLPIHGSEGQFECLQCKKRFKTEHYLKSHVLIHTGETPFACEICQAAFNRKDKLKRHMTIHDSVKKYRCPFRTIAGCTKEFNRPDKLKAHIITHSGIKPYKCSICNKGFSRRPHLLEHERGHNLDYRFRCDKCGKGFFRPKLFQEHKCQLSRSGTEQQFRPRNRRKIGRPRKRMISIVPDSVSKSRGKQYPSRTRTKGRILQFPAQVASNLSMTQEVRQQNIPDARNEVAVASSDDNRDDVGYSEPATVSVEVVKALPVISSAKTSGIIDIDSTGAMSVRVSGLEDGKDDGAGNSLGSHVQHISLGSAGELVDHYVVHLTESVDGSSPRIQTAFIPAVAGAQIFASSSQEMGIQPIAIIEARPFNVSDCTGKQILTTSGANAILTSHQGHVRNEGQGNITISGDYITVSEGGSILGERVQDVKAEFRTDPGGSESRTLLSSHGNLVMMRGTGGVVDMTVADRTGLTEVECKEEPLMVIGGHGLMVSTSEMSSGSGDITSDIMDGTLSLFSPPVSADSYVGGQTYIACSTHLVDYSHAVLQGPS